MGLLMMKYLDDILILMGCGLLVYATYRLNLTAALFVGGFLLIALGIAIGVGGKKVIK